MSNTTKELTFTAKAALVRNEAIEGIGELLAHKDPIRVSSTELAFPTVFADGEEGWVVVKVTVPKGSRDGSAYDGYFEAEEYEAKQAEKAEKAAAAKAKREAAEAKRAAKAAEGK